jgi:hypothetical protein
MDNTNQRIELYTIIWYGIEIEDIEIFTNYNDALIKLNFYEKSHSEYKVWNYQIIKLKEVSNSYFIGV